MSVNKLIKIAKNEVGYLEKKSNSQLDKKTANAGSNNWTKYGQDLIKEIGSPYSNGVSWCDMFVDWCFLKAFGKKKAKELLGGWSAYTPTSAQYFKNMNQWYTFSPKIGDIIFFKNSSRICHTGLVYKVDSQKVYTIEGNTSGANGLIANGGGVCKKSYLLTYKNIAGYGRPKYDGNNNSNLPPSHTINEKPIEFVGKINTKSGNLNIRSSSNSSSAKIGTYKNGELVQLIAKTSNNWYRTNKGYISGEYVIAARGKVFNCTNLNMRKRPKVETNNIVSVLNINDKVYIMKIADNGWYKVKTKNNLVGYVSNKYITIL